MFSSVFIPNRGEIAVRIIRTLRELGIESVVGYSTEDRNSLPVMLADRSVCIGPPESVKSYLNVGNIISAALISHCEAIHPGVGFLAESHSFATSVVKNGLIFIGPKPETLKELGNKIMARQIAMELGIPLTPGSEGSVDSLDEAVEVANEIGYPILLKAAAGGGGKGIRVVREERELPKLFSLVKKEAESAFGEGAIFVETFVKNPRHVEVQLLADRHGNIFVFGERDCTIQKNHQKVVEESPAVVLPPDIRIEMERDAKRLFERIGYIGAGTVEFLYSEGNYYFMEVNARIQVEHPVTEVVEGVDLIALQVLAAMGEDLNKYLGGDKGRLRREKGEGLHCIECRINALTPGKITHYVQPGGYGVRVDTHIFCGYEVSPYYDSMLAKLIVYGESRGEAITRMKRALLDLRIDGVKTNIPLLIEIVSSNKFLKNDYSTDFISYIEGGK